METVEAGATSASATAEAGAVAAAGAATAGAGAAAAAGAALVIGDTVDIIAPGNTKVASAVVAQLPCSRWAPSGLAGRTVPVAKGQIAVREVALVQGVQESTASQVFPAFSIKDIGLCKRSLWDLNGEKHGDAFVLQSGMVLDREFVDIGARQVRRRHIVTAGIDPRNSCARYTRSALITLECYKAAHT
jgi:hypothetical protein